MSISAKFDHFTGKDSRKISASDVKNRVDLRDLAARVWGEGRRTGRATMYRARWRHDDDTASFAVYVDGYKDFGTGDSGDVIDFVQNEYHLDFGGALAWLDDYLGGIHNVQPRPQPLTTSPNEPPSAVWQMAARHAVEMAETTLWQTPAILDYLRTQRGLNDDTIRAHRLGYNPRWTPVQIDNTTVYLAPGIVIPYLLDGALWAVRVRCRVGNLAAHLGINDDTNRDGDPLPKYLNLSGSKVSGTLYGGDGLRVSTPPPNSSHTTPPPNPLPVHREREQTTVRRDDPVWSSALDRQNTVGTASMLSALPSPQNVTQPPTHTDGEQYDDGGGGHTNAGLNDPPVLIVEGEFDAMLARQKLRTWTVITPGPASNTLAKRWRDLLLNRDTILALMDADDAGQSATAKLSEVLGTRLIPVQLPAGQDVTDFVIAGGNLEHMCETALTSPTQSDTYIEPIYNWSNGVPDAFRSATLTYAPPSCAPLLELVNRAICEKMLNQEAFTVADLIAVNDALDFGFSVGTLRRTVKDATGLFFAKLHTADTRDDVCKTEKNVTPPPNPLPELREGQNATASQNGVGTASMLSVNPSPPKSPSPTNGEGDLPTIHTSKHMVRSTGRTADRFRLLPVAEIIRNLLAWAKPRIIEKHHPVTDGDDERPPVLAEPTEAMLTAVGIDPALVEDLDDAYWEAYLAQDHAQGDSGRDAVNAYLCLSQSLKNAAESVLLPSGWQLGKVKHYRAAFLVATNDPQMNRSRREIAELLGMSVRSVGDIVQFAGLDKVNPDGEFETMRLKSTERLERRVNHFARFVRGYPRALIVTTPDGACNLLPYSAERAVNAIQSVKDNGGEVAVQVQVANRYKIVREGPPQPASTPTTETPSDRAQMPESAPETVNTIKEAHPLEKRRKLTPKRVYGPVHHPAWVRGQLVLALRLMGWGYDVTPPPNPLHIYREGLQCTLPSQNSVGTASMLSAKPASQNVTPPPNPLPVHREGGQSTPYMVSACNVEGLTRLVNPNTGEVVPEDATVHELLEYVLGRRISTGDDLLDFARESLGARVVKSD